MPGQPDSDDEDREGSQNVVVLAINPSDAAGTPSIFN